MDPNRTAAKRNTSHGNEVLPQDITHLLQRPSYQRGKIQQVVGSHENLLTIIKRRKLKWYGHVSRSLGQAKTTLQGTLKRGRRHTQKEVGRHHQGNGQAWSSPTPRGQGRAEKWSKLVVKSLVVPQRPLRLRDR